jgi:hypothetical protein
MAVQVRTRMVFAGSKEAARAILFLSDGFRNGDLASGIGNALATEATHVISRLTPRLRQRSRSEYYPRTKRGFPALNRRWGYVVTEAVRGHRFAAIVQNAASFTPAGAIILLALEGGAKPHEIEPVYAKVLAWREPAVRRRFLGRFERKSDLGILDRESLKRQAPGLVFWPGSRATGVLHPGHKPFKMVQKTEQHMERVVVPIADLYLREIERVWAGVGLPAAGSFSAGVRRVGATRNPINLGARRSRR